MNTENIHTIAEGKAFLQSKMNEKGAPCPCCKQFVKLYKRKLNKNMAQGLICVFKIQGDSRDFIHVPSELTKRNINAMDTEFSRLQNWGLIEKKLVPDEKSNRTEGYWRITEKGRNFVLNKIKVNKYVYIYNQELYEAEEGMDTTEINIIEAMQDEFSYLELMNATGLNNTEMK